MDHDFDVFDEWGRWVGKFTPAGAGCGDSILLLIALVFIGTIGFLFYLVFKAASAIFGEVLKTEGGRTLIKAIFTLMVIYAIGRVAVYSVQALIENQEILNGYAEFAKIDLRIEATRLGCKEECKNKRVILDVTINNDGSVPARILSITPDCPSYYGSVVFPSQPFRLRCIDPSTRYTKLGTIDPDFRRIPLGEICITFNPTRTLGEKQGIPSRKICAEIPMATY